MPIEEHAKHLFVSAPVPAGSLKDSASAPDKKNQRSGLEPALGRAPHSPARFQRQQYMDKNEHRQASLAPGAVPIFPTMVLNRRPNSLYDVEEPTTSSNTATYSSDAAQDHCIPHAFSVQDAPLVHATPAPDPYDSAVKVESRWSRRTLLVIFIAVLTVVILLAILVPVLTRTKSTASATTPFVKYRAIWAVSIEEHNSIPFMNNTLQVSCLNGGTLMAEPIQSWIDGTSPTCNAVSASVLKCFQVVPSTVVDNWAVNATLTFRCQGNDVNQLVGTVTSVDQIVTFTNGEASGEAAGQGVELYVFDATTGEAYLDSDCSVELLNVPQHGGDRCATSSECEVSSGNDSRPNTCELFLAAVSSVQRSPVKSTSIQ